MDIVSAPVSTYTPITLRPRIQHLAPKPVTIHKPIPIRPNIPKRNMPQHNPTILIIVIRHRAAPTLAPLMVGFVRKCLNNHKFESGREEGSGYACVSAWGAIASTYHTTNHRQPTLPPIPILKLTKIWTLCPVEYRSRSNLLYL